MIDVVINLLLFPFIKLLIYIELIAKRRVEYLNAKKDVINEEHDLNHTN